MFYRDFLFCFTVDYGKRHVSEGRIFLCCDNVRKWGNTYFLAEVACDSEKIIPVEDLGCVRAHKPFLVLDFSHFSTTLEFCFVRYTIVS